MHVDIIDDIEGFKRVRENWNAVYEADPEAQFFLSWTWLAQWFADAERNWFVLAARPDADASAYVAFLPLRLRTKLRKGLGFYNEINMAGNYTADYTGLICEPRSDCQAIPALARRLKTLNWARMRLENIRASDARVRLLLAHFPDRTFDTEKIRRINESDNIDNCICPHVNLPGDWDGYLGGLSANTRQKIRRFLRTVENDAAFRITHAQADTVERDLKILFGFWTSRWGARKGDRMDVILNSSFSMLLRCFESGSLFLPVLWRGETPLGALASLVDPQKGSLLFYIGGRDESFDSPPPGTVLHAYSIRHAITNGFKTYDFLRGNEAYKYSFGARERRISCFVVTTKTTRNLGEKLDRRSVPVVLRHATKLHEAGEVEDAERGYRQVLEVEPRDPIALHGLGQLLAARCNKHTAAMIHAAALGRHSSQRMH